jgi:PAS domain-containing protein
MEKSHHTYNETLFRAITEQSGEGISLADTEGNYVMINPAFCRMTGYREAELLTMNVRDLVPQQTELVLFPKVVKNKSGQKEAERERLASAIEQANDATLITDPTGTIQYANPAFEKISLRVGTNIF